MQKTEIFLQHVTEPYFSAIKLGMKTHEGKSANSSMAREVKKGDLVKFFTGEKLEGENSAQCYERLSRQGKVEEFTTRVLEILTFSNFKEMLECLGVEMMIPDSKGNLGYALAKYHEFGVNTDNQALAFHVTMVPRYL